MSVTLDTALDWLSRQDARPAVIAGGTDFYPVLGDRPAPAQFLDITAIDALQGIDGDATTGWRIGAGVTWRTLQDTPLPACFDALKAAGREVGSRQIQNRATLAGNLCNASPAADGVPALLILDAAVELASVRGTRRLSLPEFLLGVRHTALAADELLVAIHVPPQAARAVSVFHKLGARRYLVISIAMLAVLVEVDASDRIVEARIAVGACSPVAMRLGALERALIGMPVDGVSAETVEPPSGVSAETSATATVAASNVPAGTFLGVEGVSAETDSGHFPASLAAALAKSLATLTPIDDVRGSADYRRDAVATLVMRTLYRALEQACEPDRAL